MHKIFSTSLFWTNVITAVVMLFLVGTIVFGWTNPTLPPPQGSGAVSIVPSGLDLGHVSIGGKRLVNVTSPVNDSDAATKGWVNTLLGQQSGGGRSIVTLWGSCQSGINNPTCEAGEGVLSCSSLGTDVAQMYKGFGPWVYVDDIVSSAEADTVKTIDSIPVCSETGLFAHVNFSAVGYPDGVLGYSGIRPYKATWSMGSPVPQILHANTCRVCMIGAGYVPQGGN